MGLVWWVRVRSMSVVLRVLVLVRGRVENFQYLKILGIMKVYGYVSFVQGRINNRLTPLLRMAFADDCFPGARESRMLLARYAVSIECE